MNDVGLSFQLRKQNNETLNREELRRGEEVLSSYPPFFQIDLIGVCDMKPYCRMCTIDMSRTRAHGGMALEQIQEFAPFIEASRQVTNCSTGEPLLHRHLGQILDFVAERETSFGFSCNGLALTAERTAQLLDAGQHVAINFSLDATTAETYAKVRCDQFDLVMSNIRRFCRRRLELPADQRPEVGLCFIPMRLNQHEIAEAFELGRELQVDHLELRPLVKLPVNKITTHNGFTFNYEEQILSWAELQACHRVARQASARTGIRLDWQYDTDDSDGEAPYVLFRPSEERQVTAPCTMPWTFLLPYENGDTVPCCYMSSSVGNWREEGLETIWNGETLRSIRRALAHGELADECWKSASCPVVKRMQQQGADQRRRAYLARAEGAHQQFIFRAGDPELQELIEFGVFDEERAPIGRRFRWIADHGRLEIPNPFRDRPFEILLGLTDGRCDRKLPTPICNLRVNGRRIGEVNASRWRGRGRWMRIDHDPSHRLRFDFECPNAFVPGRRGDTIDQRKLGVVLDEIRIRPALPFWPSLQRLVTTGFQTIRRP